MLESNILLFKMTNNVDDYVDNSISRNILNLNSLVNLKLTQESGQTSQAPWHFESNYFEEMIYLNDFKTKSGDLINLPVLLKLSQNENDINNFQLVYEIPSKLAIQNIFEFSSIEKEIKKEIARIYDLNFYLAKFYDYLANDEKLAPSIDFCNGLRLFLAKDPFECIISSICSANNSIARWTKSISKIKVNWGEKVEFPSGTFYSFPKPSDFMNFYEDNLEESEADGKSMELECYIRNLKSCGVGYRASYMKRASEIFALERNLNDIATMSYDEAFETILETPGVGPKVADCILLYGYGFNESFPSDVWIKRIISHLYFDGKDISANKARDFGMEHFEDYAGYTQLYLFHYARKSGLMDKLKKK